MKYQEVTQTVQGMSTHELTIETGSSNCSVLTIMQKYEFAHVM